MSFLRSLTTGLRSLFRKEQADRDLDGPKKQERRGGERMRRRGCLRYGYCCFDFGGARNVTAFSIRQRDMTPRHTTNR